MNCQRSIEIIPNNRDFLIDDSQDVSDYNFEILKNKNILEPISNDIQENIEELPMFEGQLFPDDEKIIKEINDGFEEKSNFLNHNISLKNTPLKKSELVFHFIHDDLNKGYKGFAREASLDYGK